MLQQVLALFRKHQNVPLSQEAVSVELGLSPAVVTHVLHTLVQRGRLVEVETCRGCEVCPLHNLCAGVPVTTGKGYALASERAIIVPEAGNFDPPVKNE